MFKYRSKCRWNMLLHIDGEVVEIRPGEFFQSKKEVDSRYLEVLHVPKKRGRPPAKVLKKIVPKGKEIFKEEVNGSST